MKKLSYFLMVGLVFTVLQVSTVEAQSPSGSADPNAPVLTIGDPACATVPPAAGCPAGSPGMMAPPTGAPGGPPMGDPSGMPPMGDAAAKPSLGERVKSFFGMGTKDATPPAGDPGAPPIGDPNMPPPTGAPGTPPMGDAAGK